MLITLAADLRRSLFLYFSMQLKLLSLPSFYMEIDKSHNRGFVFISYYLFSSLFFPQKLIEFFLNQRNIEPENTHLILEHLVIMK